MRKVKLAISNLHLPADTLCGLLHCLTSKKVLTPRAAEKLGSLGIDIGALRQCIDEHCPEPEERVAAPQKLTPKVTKLHIKTERPARPIKMPKPKLPKMRRSAGPPVTFPRVIHMFTPESEEPMKMKPVPAKKAGKKR